MKVKLFWKKNPVKFGRFGPPFGSNDNTGPLEDEINAWLKEHPHIKITDIRQSATGGSWGPMLWSISVWYEEVGEW
jgi:hypothetical protein